MTGLLAIISSILKLFGIGAEAARQAKDQDTGAQLQKGADAQAELAIAQKAVQARDAVVPLDADGLMPDHQADPFDRDQPRVPRP